MKRTKIINLTSHNINLFTAEAVMQSGTRYTLKNESAQPARVYMPSGKVARAEMGRAFVERLDDDGVTFDVTTNTYGAPTDLPPVTPDTYYIVSLATAMAAQRAGRKTGDLLIVDRTVRNSSGQAVGCMGFAVL